MSDAGGFGVFVGPESPGSFGLSVAVASGAIVAGMAVGRGGVAVGTRTVGRNVGSAVGVAVGVVVAVAVGRGTRSGASAA